MLISFTVENWMSFREKATLSMLASREQQHGERVPKITKYPLRILPVAAIYGGNASGKTNLFKALYFAKKLVVKGTQPESIIHVEPFLLDPRFAEKPCWFKFEILIEEVIYEFSFILTPKKVEEEKLVRISSSNEQVLYHRKDEKPNFHSSLINDEFLAFAFKGTRDNQLFLTNSVTQNIKTFKPIYDWFRNSLILVAPDARFGQFGQFLQKDHPLYSSMSSILSQLDTGIVSFGGKEISLEKQLFITSLLSHLNEEVKGDKTINLVLEATHDRIIVTREDDKLKAEKLITYHQRTDGQKVKFEMSQESDGTRRLIDLLPAFLQLASVNSKKVFVIDEIDRSLHTLLTRHLIESYLEFSTQDSRSQLLFTTQDVLQMNQKLLRRDEMWVTERDRDGCSSLVSFSEYKDIRFDKDIRKSYLQGRLGGIPRILLSGGLACIKRTRENSEEAD